MKIAHEKSLQEKAYQERERARELAREAKGNGKILNPVVLLIMTLGLWLIEMIRFLIMCLGLIQLKQY